MSMFSGGELTRAYGCMFLVAALVLAVVLNVAVLSIGWLVGHVQVIWK